MSVSPQAIEDLHELACEIALLRSTHELDCFMAVNLSQRAGCVVAVSIMEHSSSNSFDPNNWSELHFAVLIEAESWLARGLFLATEVQRARLAADARDPAAVFAREQSAEKKVREAFRSFDPIVPTIVVHTDPTNTEPGNVVYLLGQPLQFAN